MKVFLSLVILLLFPVSAIAHPGKTDRRGGHKCWKNCGEWELWRGEYHLHDKDGKPIRLDQKEHVPEPAKAVPMPESQFLLEDSQKPEDAVRKASEGPAEQKIGVVKSSMMTVHTESALPFHSVLLLLCAFLLLMLLVFVRKRKEKR